MLSLHWLIAKQNGLGVTLCVTFRLHTSMRESQSPISRYVAGGKGGPLESLSMAFERRCTECDAKGETRPVMPYAIAISSWIDAARSFPTIITCITLYPPSTGSGCVCTMCTITNVDTVPARCSCRDQCRRPANSSVPRIAAPPLFKPAFLKRC